VDLRQDQHEGGVREEAMHARVIATAVLFLALAPTCASSQSKPVKIGVLNDQSGVYADDQGIGSVIAAQLAVEDFWRKPGLPV
jgi:branched-chain amino acid transport system substrate-binding protein